MCKVFFLQVFDIFLFFVDFFMSFSFMPFLVILVALLNVVPIVVMGRNPRLRNRRMVAGAALLDLDYGEDSKAAVDMNFVVTQSGKFVEIQGTGEEAPFSEEDFMALRTLALRGCRQLLDLQRSAFESQMGVKG